MQGNLTAASNKHGNVRAELLQGRSACETREASPRLIVCTRKEGKYLTFVHAWWSSPQLCACTWDPINKASGRLSSIAPSLPPFFSVLAGSMNAREIRWSRRRKPVDEEKEKKWIPQLMLKRSRCSCASCYRCLLLFQALLCRCAACSKQCLLSAHVGVSSEWIYWSLNPAWLMFLNSLMPYLFSLFVLLFIFTIKPVQSFDRKQ